MSVDFWVYLTIDLFILSMCILAALEYKKYRRKESLSTLIIGIIVFVLIILAYFYPADEWLHVGTNVKILILVAFVIIVLVSLFYFHIKYYIYKLRKK